MNRLNGFTLLEILIAMALFSIIALATARQISLIRNTKDAAFQQIDLYNEERAGLSVMNGDLQQAFHVLYDDLGDEAQILIQQAQPVAHTLFDGRKTEMVFTSLSHRNYYADNHECSQTEISYFLQSGTTKGYSSLMKRESERIDDDLYHGGGIYTLFERVASLKYEYWDDKQGKWQETWNSDSADYRDRFPTAIKMTAVIADAKGQTLSFTAEFKVAFSNNDPYLVQF